jgi:outer membrane protein assembly factor BamB
MKLSFACVFALVFCTLSHGADNWPNWRGPNYNGVASGEKYPTTWSATENVLWKADLPGRGSSTPVIWGDNIFLTYGNEGKNYCVCFNRAGKQLWVTSVGEERASKHKKATGSNPSVVTDGTHVWAYFKSGDLACLDLQGKIVWQENLQKKFGEDTLWWDLGTSPILTKAHVIVTVMQDENSPSYLAAFEKASGKLAWKEDRILDAPSEAAQSYTTPLVVNENGQEIIIVLGADYITGHNAATGKEIWRVGTLNPAREKFFRSIASAVVSDGIVVAPYARGKTLTAVKLGGSGDVTKSHVAWTKTGLGSDVPTPAAHNGKVYICTDKGELACLDIKTGEEKWKGQAEKNRGAFSASVSIAGGNIYITREDGKTFVHALGDEFKVLATNSLGDDMVVATPVFVDGHIYIRSEKHLYCVGK